MRWYGLDKIVFWKLDHYFGRDLFHYQFQGSLFGSLLVFPMVGWNRRFCSTISLCQLISLQNDASLLLTKSYKSLFPTKWSAWLPGFRISQANRWQVQVGWYHFRGVEYNQIQPPQRLTYCWWKKSCTSWYVVYPIIYKVYVSQVVVWDFFHQQ